MSAARLREAADRLDALAEAATDGPWFVVPIPGHTHAADVGTTDDPDEGMGVCCGTLAQPSCALEDAAYIAAMHPGIGRALAAWLRAEADTAMFPDDPADPHALAVADAILGGAA